MPNTPTSSPSGEDGKVGSGAASPSPDSVPRKASDPKKGRWKRLTVRERMLVKGLASGLTVAEAARRAGYPDKVPSRVYQTIKLTHIESALTEAIDRAGLTDDKLAAVLSDALTAKRVIVGGSVKAPVIREVDDHDVRLRAYDRVAAAKGLVPKVCDLPEAPAPAVNIIIRERAGGPVIVNRTASAPDLDCGEGVQVAISERKAGK